MYCGFHNDFTIQKLILEASIVNKFEYLGPPSTHLKISDPCPSSKTKPFHVRLSFTFTLNNSQDKPSPYLRIRQRISPSWIASCNIKKRIWTCHKSIESRKAFLLVIPICAWEISSSSTHVQPFLSTTLLYNTHSFPYCAFWSIISLYTLNSRSNTFYYF